MQRRILSFIHQHREQFPSDGLAQLVETIPSTEISHEWVRALVNMIRRHCKSQQIESNARDRGNEPKHAEPIYTFCPSSQSNLKDLFLALQSKGLSSVVAAQTKTEEDMICESDMKDESIRPSMDVDVEEYQTQQKAVNQSQLRNIGFSSQRASFDTFISQRNHILEGHMQVRHRYTCMGLLLWPVQVRVLSRSYS